MAWLDALQPCRGLRDEHDHPHDPLDRGLRPLCHDAKDRDVPLAVPERAEFVLDRIGTGSHREHALSLLSL